MEVFEKKKGNDEPIEIDTKRDLSSFPTTGCLLFEFDDLWSNFDYSRVKLVWLKSPSDFKAPKETDESTQSEIEPKKEKEAKKEKKPKKEKESKKEKEPKKEKDAKKEKNPKKENKPKKKRDPKKKKRASSNKDKKEKK